jgi:Lrp/AsnC family transcriptional regulator, leucine-responsive regulatory protein
MENLDKNDKKILSFLGQDARVPLTVMAKRLQASPQTVKYHFDKLVSQGILKGFWPTVDFRRIGYLNISYFLKLKNITPEVEKEMLAYLTSHNEVNIAMSGDGFWDLHITFSTVDIFSNQNAFEKFYEQFNANIADYKTATPVGFYQFPRKYLQDKTASFLTGSTGTNVELVTITDLQKQILELLNSNARFSYNEIADRLATSRQTIVRNIASLEQSGVIQGYTILLDHQKIGMYLYRTLIQMKSFNPKRQQELFNFCKEHKSVVSYLKLVGNWQLLIDVEVDSALAMRDVSRELKAAFGDLIEYVEPTLVYTIHKFRDIPQK